MLSWEPRCIYRTNALSDVVCQLIFPRISQVDTQPPAAFHSEIRQHYPLYSVRIDDPPPAMLAQGEHTEKICIHQFSSADGNYKINLSGHFISVACSKYTRWEVFSRELDRALAVFLNLYHPEVFQRIGLRYLNLFSRRDLNLEQCPFRELITPAYLGPLAQKDVDETKVSRCTVDTVLKVYEDCHAKIHAGPGLLRLSDYPDPEVKFVLDMDLFLPAPTPVSQAAAALERLHAVAYPIFRGAITDRLHRRLLELPRK